jgi:hypothetical protein
LTQPFASPGELLRLVDFEAIGQKTSVELPGQLFASREKVQDGFLRNQASAALSDKFGMTTPGKPVKIFKTNDHPRTNRIQVNIPHQFEEIRIFVTDDGFITVLKEMSGPIVAQIENDSIAGQQTPHESGQCALFRAHQEMKMIIEQGPGKAPGARLLQKGRKACEKILSVLIVKKDVASFDAPDNDVMQKTGNVYTGITWHTTMIAANVKIAGTSPSLDGDVPFPGRAPDRPGNHHGQWWLALPLPSQ